MDVGVVAAGFEQREMFRDVFKARIYLGVPIFGETKTLQRVTRLGLEGWC